MNRYMRYVCGRQRRILFGIALLALLMVTCGVFLFRPPLPADFTLPRTDLRLAAWLGVTWSNDVYSLSDIQALAAELQAHQVNDLFIYVSYLNADGSFNSTFGSATEFVEQMKSIAPEMRLLAWIGVPTTMQLASDVNSDNRLLDTRIRQAIADFSRHAASNLGFDGVHLNVEPVANGDPMFLETLKVVRKNLPVNALLSTTAHPLRLESAWTTLPYPTVAHHWTPNYFRRVAESSDQIVLMAYDSGLPFPRDYLNWLKYQVTATAASLKSVPGELIIGLPASEEWTTSHQTQAESLRIALVGLHAGIDDRVDGMAVYPYWETDEYEWRLIDTSLRH